LKKYILNYIIKNNSLLKRRVLWKEEKELGFAERGGEHEQVEDRVV